MTRTNSASAPAANEPAGQIVGSKDVVLQEPDVECACCRGSGTLPRSVSMQVAALLSDAGVPGLNLKRTLEHIDGLYPAANTNISSYVPKRIDDDQSLEVSGGELDMESANVSMGLGKEAASSGSTHFVRRSSRVKKDTTAYDQKYHPLDLTLRPNYPRTLKHKRAAARDGVNGDKETPAECPTTYSHYGTLSGAKKAQRKGHLPQGTSISKGGPASHPDIADLSDDVFAMPSSGDEPTPKKPALEKGRCERSTVGTFKLNGQKGKKPRIRTPTAIRAHHTVPGTIDLGTATVATPTKAKLVDVKKMNETACAIATAGSPPNSGTNLTSDDHATHVEPSTTLQKVNAGDEDVSDSDDDKRVYYFLNQVLEGRIRAARPGAQAPNNSAESLADDAANSNFESSLFNMQSSTGKSSIPGRSHFKKATQDAANAGGSRSGSDVSLVSNFERASDSTGSSTQVDIQTPTHSTGSFDELFGQNETISAGTNGHNYIHPATNLPSAHSHRAEPISLAPNSTSSRSDDERLQEEVDDASFEAQGSHGVQMPIYDILRSERRTIYGRFVDGAGSSPPAAEKPMQHSVSAFTTPPGPMARSPPSPGFLEIVRASSYSSRLPPALATSPSSAFASPPARFSTSPPGVVPNASGPTNTPTAGPRNAAIAKTPPTAKSLRSPSSSRFGGNYITPPFSRGAAVGTSSEYISPTPALRSSRRSIIPIRASPRVASDGDRSRPGASFNSPAPPSDPNWYLAPHASPLAKHWAHQHRRRHVSAENSTFEIYEDPQTANPATQVRRYREDDLAKENRRDGRDPLDPVMVDESGIVRQAPVLRPSQEIATPPEAEDDAPPPPELGDEIFGPSWQ